MINSAADRNILVGLRLKNNQMRVGKKRRSKTLVTGNEIQECKSSF